MYACVEAYVHACGWADDGGGGAMWTVRHVFLFNKTLRELSHTATTK